MPEIPREVADPFYSGIRSNEVPFVVGDSVSVVAGTHAGLAGAVISIEELRPDLILRVELGNDGRDVALPASQLRLMPTTG